MIRGKAYYLIKLAERGWTSLLGCSVIIDVSYPTILAMRNRGQIEATAVGGITRVYEPEVMRLLGRVPKPKIVTTAEKVVEE